MASETATTEQIELPDHGVTVAVTLGRQEGSKLEAQRIEVTATEGERLTPKGLRELPWNRVLDLAAERVSEQAQAQGLEARLVRPSDPPKAFTRDYRGSAGRSEADYIDLALSYLAAGEGNRHKLATDWSNRFGNSATTWRKHLAKAKAYVEGAGSDAHLNDHAMRVLFGDSYAEALAVEDQLADEEDLLLVLDRSRWPKPESKRLSAELERITAKHKQILNMAWAKVTEVARAEGKSDLATIERYSQTLLGYWKAEALQRVTEFYPADRTEPPTLPELIEAATSHDALRQLWAENQTEFDQDSKLLAQYKSKGKALTKKASKTK